MSKIRQQAQEAKEAASLLACLTSAEKDRALQAMKSALQRNRAQILAANALDMQIARDKGTSQAMLDRLSLSEARMLGLESGLEAVIALDDPTGKEVGWTRPNGLSIRKVQVPLGVVAIIYEARPNVTVDTAILAFKAGCACLLRGSSSAHNSNFALTEALDQALIECHLPAATITQLEDSSREDIDELVTLKGLVDCVIPRGGAGLISRVAQAATVPIIETGVGNCHLYVHKDADQDMAIRILLNGKTQRPAVCNALETLLIDEAIASEFLPKAAQALGERGVTIHGCPKVCALASTSVPADESDWGKEYLDLHIAARCVSGIEEAVEHINRWSTGHSEAIITESRQAARYFQQKVSSCAVYVNASTRFTDGGEFGFGAEVGISTQKLHARGPFGLEALTTCKYLIDGDGQVR